MAYREPSPRTLHVVRYGPFPRPRVSLVMGLLGGPFLIAGAVFIAWSELPPPGGRDSTPLIPMLIVGGLGLFLIAIGAGAMRAPSSIRILVDGADLHVIERWVGIPLRRSIVRADGVHAIRVERGHIKHFTDRHETPAGRLVLVTADGERPLTPRLLPGKDAHKPAAAELRRLLLDDSEIEEEPTAVTSTSPAAWSWRGMLFFFAGVFAIALLAQLAMTWYADRTQGWLEVDCRSHCRFGSMDCLPGGAWSTSIDPGDYTIEVLEPDGGWRPVVVHVELSETTRFVCEREAGR